MILRSFLLVLLVVFTLNASAQKTATPSTNHKVTTKTVTRLPVKSLVQITGEDLKSAPESSLEDIIKERRYFYPFSDIYYCEVILCHFGGQAYVVDRIILTPGDARSASNTLYASNWLPNQNPGNYVLTAATLEGMPVVNLNDQLSTLPGFYQRRAGGELNVAGARTDGNLYIIDGIQLQ